MFHLAGLEDSLHVRRRVVSRPDGLDGIEGKTESEKNMWIQVDIPSALKELYWVWLQLYKTIGPRKISKFIQELVRPLVIRPNLESAYADMAKDDEREKEAMEWAEATFGDIGDETA